MTRRVVAAVLAILLLVVSGGPAGAWDSDGSADENSIVLTARTAASVISVSSSADPAVRLDEYTREILCGPDSGAAMNANCTGYDSGAPLPDCGGAVPVAPVWHRHRDTPEGAWQQWTMVLGWTCPQDALPAFTQTDLRRLPLSPSVLHVQPSGAEVLVNKPTIVFTDAAPQVFVTDLAGAQIEVEAQPVAFAWDFGDGSAPITTTSPGHPYPDHDVAYPYPGPGTYVITLTTQFSARYRVVGTTLWMPVDGTAVTTTTTDPITAIEVSAHLVSEDCIANPAGPYC